MTRRFKYQYPCYNYAAVLTRELATSAQQAAELVFCRDDSVPDLIKELERKLEALKAEVAARDAHAHRINAEIAACEQQS